MLVFVSTQRITPMPLDLRISHDVALADLGNVRHFPWLVCAFGDIALMAHVFPILRVAILLLLSMVCGCAFKLLLKVIFCNILKSFLLCLAVVNLMIVAACFLCEGIMKHWSPRK